MNDAEAVLQRLKKLQDELGELRDVAVGVQEEIQKTYALPENGPVVLANDERGVINSVTFSKTACDGLEPDELEREINHALFRSFNLAGYMASLFDASASQVAEGRDIVQLLDSSTIESAKEFSNDSRTVTVTAAAGNISQIKIDHYWLQTEAFEVIGEQIVAVGARAMLETDLLHRFSR